MAKRVPAELLHNNTEIDPGLKSHVVTPGMLIVDGIVPGHMDMMTKDQSRQRSGSTTTPRWTP